MFDPFADLNVRDKAHNGVTAQDLGQTAFNVAATLQRINRTWQDVDEQCHQAWLAVAMLAIRTMDLPPGEQATLELSAKALSKSLYRQFGAEMYCASWEELDSSEQTIWEAIGRHLANLIDSDGQQNFSELESKIVEWARSKIEQHQLVLS